MTSKSSLNSDPHVQLETLSQKIRSRAIMGDIQSLPHFQSTHTGASYGLKGQMEQRYGILGHFLERNLCYKDTQHASLSFLTSMGLKSDFIFPLTYENSEVMWAFPSAFNLRHCVSVFAVANCFGHVATCVCSPLACPPSGPFAFGIWAPLHTHSIH